MLQVLENFARSAIFWLHCLIYPMKADTIPLLVEVNMKVKQSFPGKLEKLLKIAKR